MNYLNLVTLNIAVLSGNSGRDILNDARSSQVIFQDTFDYQWSQYIGTDNSHPIWLIFTYLATLIAAILLFTYIADYFKKISSNDFEIKDLLELKKIIIVGIFLANNAALTGTLALGMRGLIKGINYQVIDTYGLYQNATLDYANENPLLTNDAVRAEVNNANLICGNLIIEDSGKYQECIEEQLTKAQLEIENTDRKELSTKIGEFLIGLKNNTYDLATYTTSSALLAEDRIKLYTNAITFSLGADIALFFTALFGPIAIATSLIPAGANSFIAWLSAFYAIGFTQISNTTMMAFMSDILNNGRGVESFITASLIGKIIPTLAVAFGGGGGFILYSSLIGMGLGASGSFSMSKLIPKKSR